MFRISGPIARIVISYQYTIKSRIDIVEFALNFKKVAMNFKKLVASAKPVRRYLLSSAIGLLGL